MHIGVGSSPAVIAANHAWSGLQKLYEKYLRCQALNAVSSIQCGVKHSIPVATFFAELGLKPLHFFWWEQSVKFWNKLAALPHDSLFHTVLQENMVDAFQHCARKFCFCCC